MLKTLQKPMSQTIQGFSLTLQSYSIVSELMKAFGKVHKNRIAVVFVHVPGQGWQVINIITGASLPLQHLQSTGFPNVRRLPKVSIGQWHPRDGEQLVD